VANTLGVGFDAGDSAGGNWYLISRDATTLTKINLSGPPVAGATGALPRNTTDVYELLLTCGPNQSNVFVRITNLTTGVVGYAAYHSANLPVPTAFLYVHAQLGNVNSGSAVQFELMSLSLDSRQPNVVTLTASGAVGVGKAVRVSGANQASVATTSLPT